MSPPQRFTPGSAVVVRDIWQGTVIDGRPMTVVEDSDALVALHLAPGTTWAAPAFYGRHNEGWKHAASGGELGNYDVRVWHSTHVLMLMRPGDPYSPQGFWSETGDFIRWYVNLQDPFRRTEIGFDTMDHLLDIIASDDLSSWEWKDQDHVDTVTDLGLITPEMAKSVRQNGEEVGRLIERGEAWWGQWREWTPPRDSSVAALPTLWDRISQTNG